MTSDTRAWLDGLRAFVATQRERCPLATADRDGPARVAERAILAADLTVRLATLGDLLGFRATGAGYAPGGDADPVVVVTTSAVGIGVVAELLAASTSGLLPFAAGTVAVTELEYRLWCIRRPDDARRLHVNLWSWVKTNVPEQRWPEFARHPLRHGEVYWLHRTGVAGVGAADARHCHLWKWNGRHAALLQAFVRERAVGRLGAEADRGGAGATGRD